MSLSQLLKLTNSLSLSPKSKLHTCDYDYSPLLSPNSSPEKAHNPIKFNIHKLNSLPRSLSLSLSHHEFHRKTFSFIIFFFFFFFFNNINPPGSETRLRRNAPHCRSNLSKVLFFILFGFQDWPRDCHSLVQK